jgi:FkbM family methyltransferase
MGLQPRTVIDVGVAAGTWPLYEAFPSARIVLIDPAEESRAHLERIAARFPRVEIVMAAASARTGSVRLNVHRDVARSSTYWESDFEPADVTQRDVAAITLDDLRRERRLEGPFVLKVDVQGAELEVLEGASETLRETEYVILETCLFQFFAGAPLLAEVVGYMKERGFVVYDALSIQYRPLDGAMSVVDLAFVKESGDLRRAHRFQSHRLR